MKALAWAASRESGTPTWTGTGKPARDMMLE